MSRTALIVLLVILIILLAVGIGLYIYESNNYNNIVKNESPLCLSGGCKAQSNACGWQPFKVENGAIVCNANSLNVPGVTTGTTN
jgi:hypothetical protein